MWEMQMQAGSVGLKEWAWENVAGAQSDAVG